MACIFLLLAATHSYAADVFVSPAVASAAATEQEARIARLEEALKKALEKMEKSDPVTEEVKQGGPAPTPMPSPLVKGAPGAMRADFAVLPLPVAGDMERILGVMNGAEIYVLDGVVRKREIPPPAAGAANTRGKR